MNILILAIADNGGGTYFLSRAINEHTEHHARAVRWTQNYLNYPYDLLHPAPDTLRELWAWADVIHIRDAATYLPAGLPRKPTVITYTGNFYRKNHTEYHRRARQAGAVVTVSTPDLRAYDPDRPAWLPNPRNDKAHLRQRDNGDDCLVIHAPTVRADKGTQAVIDALADMPGVTLQLIEGLPYDECLRLKATGRILIDQFKYGYGNNAIEAWAIGMPVISGALPEFIDEHIVLGPLPFVAVSESAESIREAVEHLRTDRRFYREMMLRGRDHFFRYHHAPVVAARAVEFYRQAIDQGPAETIPQLTKPRWGMEGLIRLIYRGTNWGTESWTGPITGILYKFSRARPAQTVDQQDAPYLLKHKREGKPIFQSGDKIVNPPPAITPHKRPATAPKPKPIPPKPKPKPQKSPVRPRCKWGEKGFVNLEYLGANWGTEPWTGAATGAPYKFGKARPVQWVDKQDAAYLLKKLGRDGKPLFREAQP